MRKLGNDRALNRSDKESMIKKESMMCKVWIPVCVSVSKSCLCLNAMSIVSEDSLGHNWSRSTRATYGDLDICQVGPHGTTRIYQPEVERRPHAKNLETVHSGRK